MTNAADAPAIDAPKMAGDATGREVLAWHGALQTLANRFLPTLGSDLRVARLLSLVAPYAQPAQARRVRAAHEVMERYGGAAGLERMSDVARQAVMAEVGVAQTAIDAEGVEIPALSTWPKLAQNDLPKERVGEEGWKNGAQIAAIVADLGVLFEYPKE